MTGNEHINKRLDFLESKVDAGFCRIFEKLDEVKDAHVNDMKVAAEKDSALSERVTKIESERTLFRQVIQYIIAAGMGVLGGTFKGH